jgi:translation initiation factor 2B subunit (eIF-2B alpha/beta/delta family)
LGSGSFTCQHLHVPGGHELIPMRGLLRLPRQAREADVVRGSGDVLFGDVTPASCVDAIITEWGIARFSYDVSLLCLVGEV